MLLVHYYAVILAFHAFQGILGSRHEERLLADLFGTYQKAARPVTNDHHAVTMKFGLTLSQIIDVHEKNQILVISAWIRQKWFNPILTWNPLKYNNISEINVSPYMIWKPDIVLYNNADEDKTFGGNLDRLKTRAQLRNDGLHTWLAPIILKSKCDIDVRYFPFDTQNCSLKFGSWTYALAKLNLTYESNKIDIEKYSNNSEWYLIEASAKRNEVKYTCCPELYPDVTYRIVIKRRSLFYLCNLIFPMTVIGMLTMLSFLLPAESGERVSLAITLLLAMTVFMLVVADIIPATSDVIPLVGIFFSASMIEMVMMIIVLCYIMRLHHKSAQDPPMPLWMRKIVLDWLSYVVRIRVRSEPCKPDLLDALDSQNNNAVALKNMARKHHVEAKWQHGSNHTNSITNVLTNRKCVNQEVMTYYAQKPNMSDLLLGKMDVILEKLRHVKQDDKIKSDWRVVAMTIDRILLIVFALLVTATLVACFSMSPGYVS